MRSEIKKSRWTKAQLALLKEHYENGVPLQKSVEVFGRRPSTISQKAHDLGLEHLSRKRGRNERKKWGISQSWPLAAVKEFAELQNNQCHYIENDPVIDGEMKVCGEKSIKGRRYCAHHMAICYINWRGNE